MDWSALWRHIDGLVHVVGRYHDADGHRGASSECGLEIVGIPTLSGKRLVLWVRSNTRFPFPTCIACWDASNFGSYAPR